MQSVSGLNRNSEFYFPEILNDPRGEVAGNTQVKGKQNSLFPEEPVIKCFVLPPNSKIEEKFVCSCRVAYKFAAVSRSTTWVQVIVSQER